MSKGYRETIAHLLPAILAGFFVTGVIYAGSILSPGAPTAQSYTTADIYTRLTTNAAATAGNHSLSPTTTPQASFYSLTDLYNAIPTIYATDLLSTSTYLGITGSVEVKTGDTVVTGGTVNSTSLRLVPPIGYYDGIVTVSTTSANFIASNIKNGVYLFGVTGNYSAGGSPTIGDELPLKTGQTLCYTSAGAITSCVGTEQDGDLLIGTARSYTDNADGTISDNSTGLMWEKCTQGLSGASCGTGTATAMNFNLATSTCASATTGSHTDWRLPNINELGTLVDYGRSNPSIDTTYFPATVANDYFSSTNGTLFRPDVFLIDFFGSDVNDEAPTNNNYVRCVRVQASPASSAPSQPVKTGQVTCYNHSTGVEITCAGTGQDGDTQAGADRSFTDNDDNTITDNVTGLMWEKCPYRYSNTFCDDVLSGSGVVWNLATSTCSTATTGSHTDWRLPNVNEMKSLINYRRGGQNSHLGSFDEDYFPGANSVIYNTSTTYHAASTTYHELDFSEGLTRQHTKTSTNGLRCVRNTP